jgi:prevent-host-death family protein
LEREHGRVIITKHGRPAVALLSIEKVQAGTSTPVTKEQALESIKDR